MSEGPCETLLSGYHAMPAIRAFKPPRAKRAVDPHMMPRMIFAAARPLSVVDPERTVGMSAIGQ